MSPVFAKKAEEQQRKEKPKVTVAKENYHSSMKVKEKKGRNWTKKTTVYEETVPIQREEIVQEELPAERVVQERPLQQPLEEKLLHEEVIQPREELAQKEQAEEIPQPPPLPNTQTLPTSKAPSSQSRPMQKNMSKEEPALKVKLEDQQEGQTIAFVQKGDKLKEEKF